MLGVSRRENVAVAGFQTPTSPRPSSFQSPATGRLVGVPHTTFCVETTPVLLTVRSVNVDVLAL
jgi:hypothetical protein